MKRRPGAILVMHQSPPRCLEWALSEETARARETTEPYVSRRTELPPFGQSDGTVLRENFSAVEVTFLIEMVVDRSVDRSEFL